MTDDEVDAFDDYWRTISRNEDYIQQYGHNAYPAWKDVWHHDLENAYSRVRPFLNLVTQRRMFLDLLGDRRFEAENFHHALMLILNPPERWFGNVGILQSREYIALKQSTAEEKNTVNQGAIAVASTGTPPSPFETLTDAAMAILQAMDEHEPRSWKQIATRADIHYDTVRQLSTPLQEKSLVKKTPRGFIRLVQLPNNADGL